MSERELIRGHKSDSFVYSGTKTWNLRISISDFLPNLFPITSESEKREIEVEKKLLFKGGFGFIYCIKSSVLGTVEGVNICYVGDQ